MSSGLTDIPFQKMFHMPHQIWNHECLRYVCDTVYFFNRLLAMECHQYPGSFRDDQYIIGLFRMQYTLHPFLYVWDFHCPGFNLKLFHCNNMGVAIPFDYLQDAVNVVTLAICVNGGLFRQQVPRPAGYWKYLSRYDQEGLAKSTKPSRQTLEI